MSHNRFRVPRYMREVYDLEKWKSTGAEKTNIRKKRASCKGHWSRDRDTEKLVMPTHLYYAKRFEMG